MTLYVYDTGQLAVVREVIAGLPFLTPDEIAVRDAAVADGKCSLALWPLWPLAEANPEVWEAVRCDPRIDKFSVYGLFPATCDLVYGDDRSVAQVRYDGRTRGRVAIISGQRDGHPVNVVVKPCQSRRETEIAAIAGSLGVGPKQLPSIDGFITEEFVNGEFLTDMSPNWATPERMRQLGVALGSAISRLHDADVCYNDATLADPDGRSHLIMQQDGSFRLIDFGVAFLLQNHPAGLTFADVYNAALTDPMFRLFRQLSNPADDALDKFIDDYGRRLAGQSVVEIQSRDWRIAEQGTHVVASRFGAAAADALREGMAQ